MKTVETKTKAACGEVVRTDHFDENDVIVRTDTKIFVDPKGLQATGSASVFTRLKNAVNAARDTYNERKRG